MSAKDPDPSRRLILQPAELAATYVLLASPESSYATGQVFGGVGGRSGP